MVYVWIFCFSGTLRIFRPMPNTIRNANPGSNQALYMRKGELLWPVILQDCHLYFSGREYTRYEEYDETSEEWFFYELSYYFAVHYMLSLWHLLYKFAYVSRLWKKIELKKNYMVYVWIFCFSGTLRIFRKIIITVYFLKLS
jgi:hypothetical protein